MKNQFPIELLRSSLQAIIKEHHPELLKEKFLTSKQLDEVKRIYFMTILESVEENVDSRKEIVDSLIFNDFLATNINTTIDEEETFSDKISSSISSFLGSWYFIILIFLLILSWVIYNTFIVPKESFDPYPYALLGFLLTGLSALQSPFILNSQAKQSHRDRLKFDEDYQTNLKAELEIRNLHSKMDHYNGKVWSKLEEIEKNLKR